MSRACIQLILPYEGGGKVDIEEFVKIAYILKPNPHEIVESLEKLEKAEG